MTADDNTEIWLSVAGAARQLGLSRQAIQNRIKRGRIEHRVDNRGNPIVRVAATQADSVSGATAFVSGATPATGGKPRKSVLPPVAPDTNLRIVSEAAARKPDVLPPVAPDTVPLSVLQQALDAVQRGSDAALAAVREQHKAEVDRLRADHDRQRRDDAALTALVAVLALAVIAILGPVVWR